MSNVSAASLDEVVEAAAYKDHHALAEVDGDRGFEDSMFERRNSRLVTAMRTG